jgi:outer membrane protein TolC
VLSAEDALLNSLRILTDLQSRAFTLDVALKHALGGGYREAPLQLAERRSRTPVATN